MATSMQLRREILAGERDAALAALYGADPAVLARQRQRYADALEQFERYFGPGRQVHIYSAPGRAGAKPETALYFICRSGARSLAAAQTAQAAGYRKSFNVADGFEGPPDASGHRGTVAGWKAEGMPWRQR